MAALANSVFRTRRPGRMELQYPLLYEEGNLSNWRLALAGGAVVSMAGVLPLEVRIQGRCVRVCSLGSVCTHPRWRRRGIAFALLRALEARMLESGVRVMLISGGGGLYERFGATRAGRFSIIEVPGTGEGSGAPAVRPMTEDDLEAVEALHREETTRYERTLEQLRELFRCGHLCDCPRAAFLIEDGGTAVAYAAVALTVAAKEYARTIVEEYGGDRESLWRALPRIAQCGEGPLFVRARSDDTTLRARAAASGASVHTEWFPGTLKVLDPRGLCEDLLGRRLAAWPPEGNGEALPDAGDAAGWTRLFLGTPTDAPERAPESLEGLSLPIPFVAYGFNYV